MEIRTGSCCLWFLKEQSRQREHHIAVSNEQPVKRHQVATPAKVTPAKVGRSVRLGWTACALPEGTGFFQGAGKKKLMASSRLEIKVNLRARSQAGDLGSPPSSALWPTAQGAISAQG